MKHFLLTYELADDYLDRRPDFREAHLQLAWEAADRGALLLGGAFNPADTAMLLFRAETAATAEEFARADPYVIEGLVSRWTVREWTTVVGEQAATPVKYS